MTDCYNTLLAFPGTTLNADFLSPLQMEIAGIIKRLRDENVFQLQPSSISYSQNPRALPREKLSSESDAASGNLPVKKRGRPSRRDKVTRSKAALTDLEQRLQSTELGSSILNSQQPSAQSDSSLTNPTTISLRHYQASKESLLNDLQRYPESGRSALERANQNVLERLKKTEQLAGTQRQTGSTSVAGIGRIERAVAEISADSTDSAGLLHLLEGAGRQVV